jgi:hypothetical protein
MTDNLQEKTIKFYKATGFLLCETQRIERLLKTLLMFLNYDGSSSIIECLEKNKAELDNKSLGQLLNYFKNKAESNPDGANTLQTFLDHRNQFAHHLIELPGFNALTIEGLEIGLNFIKEYRRSMLLVESILVPICMMSLIGWLIAFYTDAPDDPLKQQIIYLRERLDSVNKLLSEEYNIPVTDQHEISAPDGTLYFHDYLKMVAIVDAVNTKSLDKLNLNQKIIELWERQKIIIALKAISVSCVDDQGWAALATCGQLLRQNYPDIQLADYGVEKLSALIEISNVFEIKKEGSGFYFRPMREAKILH